MKKAILLPFVVSPLLAALLFGSAGRIGLPWAWGAWGMLFVNHLIGLALFWRLRPELVEERMSPGEGIQSWDKTLLRLYILSVLIYLVFTGLDIGRMQWLGGIPAAIRPAGGIFLLASLSLVYWAMLTNQFFSTVVRLQEDRGQYVITTGPYRFVRHPGYLSVIGTWIGFSVMVGSWIGLLSTTIPSAVMIVRTLREDRFLQEQLTGYEEYCRKVRWRLMPYVW